ncbi:hypothetical protein SK224_00185 [Microbacterium sp. BG28]|uniref:hypothetical protein n=1 Tax=Microbacterium sp. BG28 TaxID=3097356 RepID=UPI002A59F8A4|nr:hypothetical protein [Microbacterium sp. BG28]MDY0827537.1 hypothetical protein [Microbacterium sp. BG28]
MSNNNDSPGLSKNLAFAAVAIIVVLGVIGVVLLHLFRPDASATFIQTIATFAGILTTTITLLYGLGKVQERVEVVQKQTNGTLSELRAQLAEKDAEIAKHQADKVELARQVPTGD